jgi:hypothetical protein
MASQEFQVKTTLKDFFEDCTLPVLDWLANKEGQDAKKAWSDFMAATKAVTSHEWWEWELRHEPYVGYDVKQDSHYFIFKIDNNGTTFVVSEFDIEVG